MQAWGIFWNRFLIGIIETRVNREAYIESIVPNKKNPRINEYFQQANKLYECLAIPPYVLNT